MKAPNPSVSELLFRFKWTDSGLLILSRFPITQTGHRIFRTAAMGVDAGASKGGIFACISVSENVQLSIFNCHLQGWLFCVACYVFRILLKLGLHFQLHILVLLIITLPMFEQSNLVK